MGEVYRATRLAARPRGRDQGAARGVRRRSRAPGALRARGQAAGARSTTRNIAAIYGLEEAETAATRAGHGAGRGADARRAAGARRRCRSTRRSRSPGRSPRRSRRRTRRASSTATSSRRTSSSPPTARSRCSTSASPRRSTRSTRELGRLDRVADADARRRSPRARHAAGVILGTAAYMARSRRAARTVDRRADIWAFGVVLFEMLTGRRLFAGDDGLRHAGRGAAERARSGALPADDAAGHPPAAAPLPVRNPQEAPARHRRRADRDRGGAARRGRRARRRRPRPSPPRRARPAGRSRRRSPAPALVGASPSSRSSPLGAPAPPAPRVVRFDIPQPRSLPIVGAPKVSPDGRHIASTAATRPARPRSGCARSTTATRVRSPAPRASGRRPAVLVAGQPLRRLLHRRQAVQGPDRRRAGAEDLRRRRRRRQLERAGLDPLRRHGRRRRSWRAGLGRRAEAGHRAGDGEDGMTCRLAAVPARRRALPLRRLRRHRRASDGIWMAKADGSDRRRVVPGLSRAEYAPPGWLLFVRDVDAGRAALRRRRPARSPASRSRWPTG